MTVEEYLEMKSRQETKEVTTKQKNLVYGLEGIKTLFGCSTTTAWRIKNSEWIRPAISQVGRKIVVDADLAGRRMFQSPGGLLLILHVRSHGTQESFCGGSCDVSVCETSGPGRCAPCLSIAISVALKASFQLHKCQCPGPSGWPDVYKRKNTAVCCAFL